MAVCTDVKHWIEEHIQVPVERAVELAAKSCTEYKRRAQRRNYRQKRQPGIRPTHWGGLLRD